MPLYMTQFTYHADAWAAIAKSPQRLAGRLSNALEQLGGRLVTLHYYFGFGEYDGVMTFEAFDDTAATSMILAALASSHVKASKTTRLLTGEELVAALQRAGEVAYRPPTTGEQAGTRPADGGVG